MGQAQSRGKKAAAAAAGGAATREGADNGGDVSVVLKAAPHPRFVLVSDLDHTMVQNEDPAHARLLAFNRAWGRHFEGDSLLVFSTGRSWALFQQLWDEAPLLAPDVLICSVGTELFYRSPTDGRLLPDARWEAALDKGWDRAKVQAAAASRPQLVPQPASEQRPHKVSFHLKSSGNAEEDAALLDALRADLAAAGVAAKVIYSGGVDVDVLPAGAGKGKALEFLLGELKRHGRWPEAGVQVNGDSGNDAELFAVPRVRGCVVANAHPELLDYYRRVTGDAAAGDAVAGDAAAGPNSGGGEAGAGGIEAAARPQIHLASRPCAGGILEALVAFGTLPQADADAAAAEAAAPPGAEAAAVAQSKAERKPLFM